MKVQLHRIWAVLPVPVVSIESMPGRLVGLCLGPLVIVRDDYLDDWPTIVHELTHCKQFWRGLGILHLLRYYGSRRYRLRAELEAFRAEIAACPPPERRQRRHESARALATSYSLGLDTDACRLLLEADDGKLPGRLKPGMTGAAVVESVPTPLPARLERRKNPDDRRRTAPGQNRSGFHRRRQVDRRRAVLPVRTLAGIESF